MIETGAASRIFGVTVVRDFAAPPEKVRRFWTERERVVKGFAPAPFSCEVRELDVRVGGRYEFVIAGSPHRCRGVYLDVSPVERLAFTISDPAFGPEEGGGVVEFARTPTGTRQTPRYVDAIDRDHAERAEVGWGGSFANLARAVEASA